MESINFIYTQKRDLHSIKDKIDRYPSDRILIQIFSGTCNKAVIDLLLEECRELYPHVSIIGVTTTGEIINAASKEHSIVLSVSFFETTKVKSLLIKPNDDLEAAGKNAADYFNQFDPKALIVFGIGVKNGNLVNNMKFLREVAKRVENSVIAGGQAGISSLSEKPLVFTEEGVCENGFAVASLSGKELQVKNTYNTSWIPIGKKMTITGVKGSTVFTIDDRSVKEIYRHYLGIENENEENTFILINEFPLMFEQEGTLITNPVATFNKDGSFEYLHTFHLGEQVRFSYSDVGIQEIGVERLKTKLHQYNPESVFVYSCASRKNFFGKDIVVDMSALDVVPASSGFFAYGEYYTDQDYIPHMFQHTMTVLSLSESESSIPAPHKKNKSTSLKSDHDLRKFNVLKILNHLIGKTTEELEEKNEELNRIANRDALTELSNRRYFDEMLIREIKSHSRADTPLSLIMMDIDFFKQFNDIYGHISGDDCLRAMGHVLKNRAGRDSDMAFRYGGEEFVCLLPCTDYAGALEVAEKIRRDLEELGIPHEGSKVSESVTVSLGVITLHCSPESDPALIVNLCDEQLYAAKHSGKNRVAGKDLSYLDKLDEAP